MSNEITSYIDYKNYEGIPTADQLTLKLVLEYYENELKPFTYTYETENFKNLTLKFTNANFPHLIGTHYAANLKYGKDSIEAKRFKGFSCYQEIKVGTIDKQTIKEIYPEKKECYKNMTKKMRFFNKLHLVLENPLAIRYNPKINGKRKNSDVNCDIILYSIIDNHYIQLGIDYFDKTYVPRTFLIDKDGEFVTDQEEITITKNIKTGRNKVEMLTQ